MQADCHKPPWATSREGTGQVPQLAEAVPTSPLTRQSQAVHSLNAQKQVVGWVSASPVRVAIPTSDGPVVSQE